jgi:hypothetical protein
MTTRRNFVAGAVVAVAAGVSRRVRAQSPIQIRISTAAPPSDFLTKALNALTMLTIVVAVTFVPDIALWLPRVAGLVK